MCPRRRVQICQGCRFATNNAISLIFGERRLEIDGSNWNKFQKEIVYVRRSKIGHVTTIYPDCNKMESSDKKKKASGGGRGGGGTRGAVSAAVLKDQRFAHVYSDPRFKASHPVSVSIPLSTFLSICLPFSICACISLPACLL